MVVYFLPSLSICIVSYLYNILYLSYAMLCKVGIIVVHTVGYYNISVCLSVCLSVAVKKYKSKK